MRCVLKRSQCIPAPRRAVLKLEGNGLMITVEPNVLGAPAPLLVDTPKTGTGGHRRGSSPPFPRDPGSASGAREDCSRPSTGTGRQAGGG